MHRISLLLVLSILAPALAQQIKFLQPAMTFIPELPPPYSVAQELDPTPSPSPSAKPPAPPSPPIPSQQLINTVREGNTIKLVTESNVAPQPKVSPLIRQPAKRPALPQLQPMDAQQRAVQSKATPTKQDTPEQELKLVVQQQPRQPTSPAEGNVAITQIGKQQAGDGLKGEWEKAGEDLGHGIEFQEFKNIEFKANQEYKVNKIDQGLVVDRLYNTKTPTKVQQPKKAELNRPISKPQTDNAPNKPQLAELQKNVKGIQDFVNRIKSKTDEIEKVINRQTPPRESTPAREPTPVSEPTPGRKPSSSLRVQQQAGASEHNITKIVFTSILLVGALIVLFAYKPEDRKRGPYIPTSDEEVESLH